jgi:hypothetical protein
MKEHQKADWKNVHKRLCHQVETSLFASPGNNFSYAPPLQMDTLVKLARTVEMSFEGHINFRFEVERVSEEEKQEQTRAAFSDFLAQHGAILSSPHALPSQLDQIVARMSSVDWQAEEQKNMRATGMLGNHVLETLDPVGEFSETPIGRMLIESSRRASSGCQHSITDVDLHHRGTNNAYTMLNLEMRLIQLPRWSCEATSRVDWYIQIDYPVMYKKILESAPGWKTVLEDEKGSIEQLVLRHTSGAIACFSDEPGYLASVARESQSVFPVLVLQPHINRAEETREIIEKNTATPRLFTAWFRVNMLVSTFKLGPDAVPRYGPGGDDTDRLDDIVKTLVDCESLENSLFAIMGLGSSQCVQPQNDSESSSYEEIEIMSNAFVRKKKEKTAGSKAFDWRAKKACRFFGTQKGCRNSNNCPFKH